MPHRAQHSIRRRTYEILERSVVGDPLVLTIHTSLILLILINVAAVVLESVPAILREYRTAFFVLETISGILFTIEYALRLWSVPENPQARKRRPLSARLLWMVRPQSIIDLLAILPFALAYWQVGGLRALLLLRLFRFFKLARYSPGLTSLIDAIYAERRALVACGVILLGAVLIAASAMNLVERDAQPERFGTIPEAMYWAIVTLTTVGYGDVVPVTGLGRAIAGMTAIAGLVMLALPVGIIASAFAREIHRRDFVVTWSMVSRVPFFADLDAGEIGSVLRRLRSQSCSPGEYIVRKGDVAHSMYLIASGEVEVILPGDTLRLSAGDSFGEAAILHRRRRVATVKAATSCRLLVLDAEDLHALMEANPAMASHIAEVVGERGENRAV